MSETILHKTKSKKDTQGNLVTEITETRIKNRDKKDKFMLLYVEAYSHLAEFPKIANKVLAEILKRMNTGDNTIALTAVARAEIRETLQINNQQISLAMKQLCDCQIIQKKKLNQRVFDYKLNPYIFGSGTWADIKKQRLQFNYNFDFESKESSMNVEVTTHYDGIDIPENRVIESEHIKSSKL